MAKSKVEKNEITVNSLCRHPDASIKTIRVKLKVSKKMSLFKKVELYRENCRDWFAQKLNGFADVKFEKALKLAALGNETDKTRNDHFFHGLSTDAKNCGLKKLHAKIKIKRLKKCRSFASLFREVDRIIYPIKWLDEMFVYDVALRLGANRGFWPERVYLQRGAKLGAKNLGLDWNARTIEYSSLPSQLHCLAAYEIEDFLCIFKNYL